MALISSILRANLHPWDAKRSINSASNAKTDRRPGVRGDAATMTVSRLHKNAAGLAVARARWPLRDFQTSRSCPSADGRKARPSAP